MLSVNFQLLPCINPENAEQNIQGGSNMTGTNCDLFTHKSSRSYLNHLEHQTFRINFAHNVAKH
jgi:hypothetical protein